MMRRVRSVWLEGVLEESLHGGEIIDLGFAYRPAALGNSGVPSWQQAPEYDYLLPVGTKIEDVFAAAERVLLVLGEPGAGKTTMLLQLVSHLLAWAEADETCVAPPEVLAAAQEVGLPVLGVPESLGGIMEERSAMAGTLVAEALAKGDMGLAVAVLAPGAVATAIGLWGTEAQQQTYLPAFAGPGVPTAALTIAEPTVLFDPFTLSTTALRDGDDFVLDGVKSAVVRGAEAELFVVAAQLDGNPALFLVESGTAGLEVGADPSMGLRAAGLSRLHLTGVRVGADALLGDTDATAYAECVRLSRLAWCALAVGTGQAVLDHVVPYVNERKAFGEPISHRQSVAFMVADIAIELQAMAL